MHISKEVKTIDKQIITPILESLFIMNKQNGCRSRVDGLTENLFSLDSESPPFPKELLIEVEKIICTKINTYINEQNKKLQIVNKEINIEIHKNYFSANGMYAENYIDRKDIDNNVENPNSNSKNDSMDDNDNIIFMLRPKNNKKNNNFDVDREQEYKST